MLGHIYSSQVMVPHTNDHLPLELKLLYKGLHSHLQIYRFHLGPILDRLINIFSLFSSQTYFLMIVNILRGLIIRRELRGFWDLTP